MTKKRQSRDRQVAQALIELNHQAYSTHCHWMKLALKQAIAAENRGEVPVGAVIIDAQGNLLAQAGNSKVKNQDATAHAEILAIRAASQVKQDWCLKDCTLYVTLEPCAMCAGAIIQSRLGLLVYGADEPKSGAVRTVINLPDSDCSNHQLQVLAGIEELACRQQLQTWFKQQRQRNEGSQN